MRAGLTQTQQSPARCEATLTRRVGEGDRAQVRHRTHQSRQETCFQSRHDEKPGNHDKMIKLTCQKASLPKPLTDNSHIFGPQNSQGAQKAFVYTDLYSCSQFQKLKHGVAQATLASHVSSASSPGCSRLLSQRPAGAPGSNTRPADGPRTGRSSRLPSPGLTITATWGMSQRMQVRFILSLSQSLSTSLFTSLILPL